MAASNATKTPSVVDQSANSDLRRRLLGVATKLFAERGYGGTSMREIVAAAGCTKPALYYYFDGKEALFRAIIDAETATVLGVVQRMTDHAIPLRDRVAQGLVEYFQHVRKNQAALAVICRAYNQREHGQPEMDLVSLRRANLTLFRQLLASGVQAGEIAADIDLDDATTMLASYVEIAVMRLVFEGEQVSDERLVRIADLFFRGVRPR